RVSSSGGAPVVIVGDASEGPVIQDTTLATTGLAANFNIYPGLVFTTERDVSRVTAINVSAVDRTFALTFVPSQTIALVTSAVLTPQGISIERQNAVDVTDVLGEAVWRLKDDGSVTRIVGTGVGGF